MFDTGLMGQNISLVAKHAATESKEELLLRLRRVIEPVSLASASVVNVPEAFESVFPHPGLQRGRLVGVSGNGGWSIGFALAGSAASGAWVAMVDVGNEGFMAARELGIPLEKLLVLQSVPVKKWASVVAALVEVVDVVVVNPKRPLGVRDARRLRARIQEQQSLLISFDGGRFWPEKLDVSLEVSQHRWIGLGEGFGHLQSREFDVVATGRRSLAGHRRSATVRRANGCFTSCSESVDERSQRHESVAAASAVSVSGNCPKNWG